MKIVPTQAQKEQDFSLESLSIRKAELKQQIDAKKLHISTSTEYLISPSKITSYFVQSITKGLNLTNGLIIGYKIIKTIKNLFRRT